MKFNDSIKKLSSIAMAFMMLLGVGVMANAQSAYGQYRQDDRYRNQDDRYGRYGDDDRVRWTKDRTREYAFLLGYHQAYSESRDLRERGYRGSFKDVPGYRNDTNGFLTWMGYRDDYRDRYRRGYEDGFKDAQNLRERRYDRDDVERVLGARLKDVYGNGNDYDDDRWGRGRNDRNGRDRDDRYGRDRDDRNGRYNRQEIIRIAQQNGYQDGLRRGQEDRRYNRGNSSDRANEYRDGLKGYRSEYGDRNAYQQGYRDGFRRGYDEGYRNSNNNGRWPRWPF
jgi:hypothetical protein